MSPGPYSQFGRLPTLISPSKSSEPLSAQHEMINMASLARRDVPPPEDALPPEWEVWQDQDGRSYFYNKDLNVTQWNRPAVDGLVVDISQIQKYKTMLIKIKILLKKNKIFLEVKMIR